jgi:ligand-binding sensor domain-containing protein
LPIIEDKSGVLWIGTNNGLNRFDKDGETFTRYMHDPQDPNTMGSRAIYSMFEDSTGTLWLAHSVGEISGLSSLDPARETFTRYAPDLNDPYSVSSLYIMSVYEDRAGTLWIINGVGTLDKYDKEAQKFELHSNQPDNPNSLNPPIAALFEDREGFLWFGTVLDGLVKLDRTTGTVTRHPSDPGDPQGIPASFVSAIFEDCDGTFWLGSLGGTLSIFDRETGKCTKHYVPDPDDPTSILPSQQVRYILEDKDDPNTSHLTVLSIGWP